MAVYFYGVDVVFQQLAVGGGVLPDLPFVVADKSFLIGSDPEAVFGVGG